MSALLTHAANVTFRMGERAQTDTLKLMAICTAPSENHDASHSPYSGRGQSTRRKFSARLCLRPRSLRWHAEHNSEVIIAWIRPRTPIWRVLESGIRAMWNGICGRGLYVGWRISLIEYGSTISK
jgi:hypothetical protein